MTWWLAYRRGTNTEVIIVKASALIQARMVVPLAGLDDGAEFQEGFELDPPRAKRVPKDAEPEAGGGGVEETGAVMPRSEPIQPMTLGNMRQLGVRSLSVSCNLCHHQSVMSTAIWPDHVAVPTFGPRMVCTRCGIIGADARPNWKEHRARGEGSASTRSGPRRPGGRSIFPRKMLSQSPHRRSRSASAAPQCRVPLPFAG